MGNTDIPDTELFNSGFVSLLFLHFSVHSFLGTSYGEFCEDFAVYRKATIYRLVSLIYQLCILQYSQQLGEQTDEIPKALYENVKGEQERLVNFSSVYK